MREEVEGKGVCDAASRVKVGGAGSGKLSGPLGCVCEGLPISRVRVGGIAGEGRRQPPPLPHPPTHHRPPAAGRAGCRQVREGAGGPRGCEEPLRAAGGSVGPGGARQRAVMSVAAQLAAAGTSCIKAGGPGCDSREPGLGSGRLAAAAEPWEGCHLGEPGSWRLPPGRAFRSRSPAPGVTSAERRAGCARARACGSGRMAVLKLCDQVGARGAERGEGGAAGAERSRSAPGAVYAQPGACTAGRGGSAPAQSPPWAAVASARSLAGEGRRGAGVAAAAARAGGRGPPLHRGRGSRAPGRAAHSGAVSLGLPRGRLSAGSGGGRWTSGERLAAPDLSRAGQETGPIPAPVRSVVFIRCIGHPDFLFSCPAAGCGVRDGVAES